MAIFRKLAGPHAFAVSMCGIKAGDRMLQIGCGDLQMVAALGSVVGLSGRACAVAETEAAAARARRATAKAGVLVEVEVAPTRQLPYEASAFDVVVIRDLIGTLRPHERVACLQEAHRILSPGGRCVIIEPAVRGGLGAFFSRRSVDARYLSSGGAEHALEVEGFKAVRRVAERDGLAFVEGTKPRP